MSLLGNTSVARTQAGCVVGSYEDVILRVRLMTTCGAIFKAFLKRAVMANRYFEGGCFRGEERPRLVSMVHGVHMNPDTTIPEADLADGDRGSATSVVAR